MVQPNLDPEYVSNNQLKQNLTGIKKAVFPDNKTWFF